MASNYERLARGLATCSLTSAFISAIRARSKSISDGDAHQFLGALQAGLGARDVDLFGALGDLREHRDTVGQHLREAERDRQVMLLRPAVPTSFPAPSSASSGVCPGSTPK